MFNGQIDTWSWYPMPCLKIMWNFTRAGDRTAAPQANKLHTPLLASPSCHASARGFPCLLLEAENLPSRAHAPTHATVNAILGCVLLFTVQFVWVLYFFSNHFLRTVYESGTPGNFFVRSWHLAMFSRPTPIFHFLLCCLFFSQATKANKLSLQPLAWAIDTSESSTWCWSRG
jgi:hypothetical protein